MSMLNFAQHVLAVADNEKQKITNLQLQKIMYFSIRNYLKNFPISANQKKTLVKSFYDTPFQAWIYGPVIPVVYDQYKYYGNMVISEKGKHDTAFKDFDQYIIPLLNEDVFSLVAKSHQQPIWKNHKKEIINHVTTYEYKINDIMAD